MQKSKAFNVPFENQAERERLLAVGSRNGYKVGFTVSNVLGKKYAHVTWTVRK
jgi:hypothetical protein